LNHAQLILRSGVNDDDGDDDDDDDDDDEDDDDETTSMTTVQKATHQTSQIRSSTYKYPTPSSLKKKNPPSIIINLHLPLPKVPTEMPSPATSVVEHTVATIEAV